MTEHLIRLRGGWEPGGPSANDLKRPFRLPLRDFPEGPAADARIVRRFQTPRLEPASDTLWLRLDAVPGLISVVLNDREIARRPFPEGPLLIPLGEDLPARNRLILVVEVLPPDRAPPPDFLWGDVALVIRRTDPD